MRCSMRRAARAIDAAIHDYAKMAGALAANQPEEFNAAMRDYRSSLVPAQTKALAKARAEVFFNQMEPFYNAMVIYVLAGLLAIFSWFNLSETLRRSACWLVGLAFAIHTTGLIYRMVLEGRPPVTNLYSSAIFIGWGACLLGMILEKFHKNGIGLRHVGGRRIHHADHRASSRAGRRHDGNDARGAGHEFLAGHARRRRDLRLRQHVCRRAFSR